MKRQFTSPSTTPPQAHAPTADRGGSVLLVMLGLLLLLMVLGFTALTYTAQEYESAVYYSESAKPNVTELPADPLFDFALEQLVVGPKDTNRQSALWPGRHSLVPNMLGLFRAYPNSTIAGETIPHDLQPFNGIAIATFADNDGNALAVPDPNLVGIDLLNTNFSPAALDPLVTSLLVNPGTQQVERNLLFQQASFASLIAGDPDYTYPDINNLFLGYVGEVQKAGSQSGAAVPKVPVVIPSFHRPQYLKRRVADGAANGSWESDSTQKGRVLRPHAGHVVLNTNGLPVRVARNNNQGALLVTNHYSADFFDPGLGPILHQGSPVMTMI